MYFLALVGPENINAQVLKFKIWMQQHFGCRVALKSPAHITLVPPFWMPLTFENNLINFTQESHHPAFPLAIELKNFDHFSNHVIFCAVQKSTPLQTIYEELQEKFQQSYPGILKKGGMLFHPHVTIANRDLRPADFAEAWHHFEHRQFAASWEARQIALLKLEEGKWKVIA